MAVSAGVYALTLEKMFLDTAALSLESETDVKGLLCTDTEAPNFSTHNFRDDITNEAPNTGNYTTGGNDILTTEIAIDDPTSGDMSYDFADPSWASSTIATVMGHVVYFDVGSAATDMLLFMQDFGTGVSTTNGTLTVTIDATNKAWYLDFTP